MGKITKLIDPKEAQIIMLKSDFKPLEPFKNSRTKWKCRCIKCKKISYPMLKHVKFYGTKCRYCAGTLVDENDAIKVMKKNGFIPLVSYPGGNQPWRSQCKICEKESSPSYSHVIQRGHCCKFCAPNADVLPDKAVAAFKIRGFEVIGNYINTRTAVKVKCVVCKQIIDKKYRDLMLETGCSVCAGNLPINKFEAIKFFRDHGFEPIDEFINTNTPWKSRCITCNRISMPTYGNVRSGKGCSYCSGNKIDPKDAVNNMIKWGYKPKEKYMGNHHNWKCEHIICGNIVSPQYAQIQQGYGGCRHCAEWGFQYDKRSYLYLITNKQLGAHKIGIGNVAKKSKSDRLHRLNIEGWRTYKIWEFGEGKEALENEKRVFKVLRKDLKLPIFLSKDQIRNEGYTETVDAESITLLQLEKIINKVIKGLQK